MSSSLLDLGAREAALEVLRRVSTQGAFAGALLRGYEAPPAERALATELVYGVLRRRGHLDRALRVASGRRLKDLDPRIHDVLRLGAYQLMFLDSMPPRAAVHETVELSKKRTPKLVGRVNQILRRLDQLPPEQRRGTTPPGLEAHPAEHVAAVGSLHADVAEVLVETFGAEEAVAFALECLKPTPATFRVNRLRAEPKAIVNELRAEPGALPYSLRMSKARLLPSELEPVRDGRISPQDEASMRVVELLDPQPQERVLDLCAAPGGKTCHIAEAMSDQGQVIAHDRLPRRLALVVENAKRLKLRSIVVEDALPPPEATFDRVLVDAPCSGLGTLRRHPEIRWRFRRAELEDLVRTQHKVLSLGAERLVAGGTLVYSVCTVTKAEGPDLVAAFVESHPELELEQAFMTGPHHSGAPDGFYAARITKRSPG